MNFSDKHRKHRKPDNPKFSIHWPTFGKIFLLAFLIVFSAITIVVLAATGLHYLLFDKLVFTLLPQAIESALIIIFVILLTFVPLIISIGASMDIK